MAKNKKKNIYKQKNISQSKRHIEYKKRISSKRFTKIFLKLILLILFYNSIEQSLEESQSDSKVTMLVKGGGEKLILGNEFEYFPSRVFINNEEKEGHQKIYNLEEGLNTVTLIFEDEINSCANMFYNVEDLIEIDLSKFNSANVRSLENMFYGCKNLKYIDISNFDTSQVNTMASMFSGCSSLKYLDISNFVTSSGNDMQEMFEELKTISHENPFTQEDVSSAMECYSKDYYNFTIDDIELLSGVRIEKNKRNGRKQADHIRLMNL